MSWEGKGWSFHALWAVRWMQPGWGRRCWKAMMETRMIFVRSSIFLIRQSRWCISDSIRPHKNPVKDVLRNDWRRLRCFTCFPFSFQQSRLHFWTRVVWMQWIQVLEAVVVHCLQRVIHMVGISYYPICRIHSSTSAARSQKPALLPTWSVNHAPCTHMCIRQQQILC